MSANKKDLSVINNNSKIKIIGQHFIQTEDCINNICLLINMHICALSWNTKKSAYLNPLEFQGGQWRVGRGLSGMINFRKSIFSIIIFWTILKLGSWMFLSQFLIFLKQLEKKLDPSGNRPPLRKFPEMKKGRDQNFVHSSL